MVLISPKLESIKSTLNSKTVMAQRSLGKNMLRWTGKIISKEKGILMIIAIGPFCCHVIEIGLVSFPKILWYMYIEWN